MLLLERKFPVLKVQRDVLIKKVAGKKQITGTFAVNLEEIPTNSIYLLRKI